MSGGVDKQAELDAFFVDCTNFEGDIFGGPVCGADSITYHNIIHLTCLNNKRHKDLNVSHEGECCRQDACLGGWPWGTGKVCSSNGRTYPSPAAVHCLRKFNSRVSIVHEGGCTTEDISARMRLRAQVCLIARHRFEVNPVCAADHKTYVNPFVFLCFKPHLTVLHDGRCLPEDSPCVRRARLEDRGTPVCGSDGVTYATPDFLACVQRSKDPSQ
ncbi:hypothetical protein AAG570_005395 [Ranatra chinensis]|uniref:Kazal-like domain-containing protein n=1 Tax=Ranatra chinensis TaxID=642074 RepID=A0ABD0Y0D3_9HEMI